ncbi:hypothetical protein Tco_0016418 [Tanacetum coccineum]
MNTTRSPPPPPPTPSKTKGLELGADNLTLEGVATELAPSDFVSQNYETLVALMQEETKKRSSQSLQARLNFGPEDEVSPPRHQKERRGKDNRRPITVVEKALKLRYQDNSEDFVAKQVHHKPHELVGSESNSAVWTVGFDHMLESVYINEQFDDKGEEGLVKLDDMLSMEENISDVKVDEQRDAQVEVDRATGQASPPPTATEVEDEVCVDVHVDPV